MPTGNAPKLVQKVSPIIYSLFNRDTKPEETIGSNFLSPRVLPSIFLIFRKTLDFQKARRVPPFTFKTLRFLSQRCSADLRRSRLVLLCQTTELILQVLVQRLIGSWRTQRLRVRVHASASNFFVQIFLLNFARLFSEKILMSPRGPPFNFFDVLQQIGCSRRPKGPFYTFQHCEIFRNEYFLSKINFSQWPGTLYPNF